LGVWRGGKGRALEKKGVSGRNEGIREGRALGYLCFFVRQNPLI
jgi:hypothetical protein